MSQGEVVRILEQKGELTEKEIADMLEITVSSVWTALNRLVKSGEVKKVLKTTKDSKIQCYIFKITTEKEQKKDKMIKNKSLSTKVLKC